MQVIQKSLVCEATQWFKPGDHGLVEITVGTIDGRSGPHYTINTRYGRVLVPKSSWIIENKSSGVIYIVSKEIFKDLFQNVS